MAAQRGHRVVLLEATAELGGQLLALCRTPTRQSYGEVVRWLAGEVARAGVDVRLETAATVDGILAEEPDAVIVATGSRPRRLEAPVGDGAHVVTA